MFVARKRPIASDVMRPALRCLDGGGPDDGSAVTRAEAASLLRTAPQTHAALVEHFKGHDALAATRATARPAASDAGRQARPGEVPRATRA